MKKRILSIILALCMVLPLTTTLTGCSDSYPFKKGAKVEQSISPDKEYTVGNLSKTGWQLKIPKNMLYKNETLTMTVLPEADNEKYTSDSVELIGTPVKISTGSQESIRLKSPVTVTMKLPKNLKITDEKLDDYVAAYYTGEGWDYIFPSITELKKGFVTFETYHFSLFSTVKLTKEEKIKLYTKKMALQAWESETKDKVLSGKVQTMFDEAFEKMGLSDSSMQGKLFRSIAKETDFGSLLVSVERGDVVDFSTKCGEMAANALIKHMKLEQSLMENLTSKGAAITSGLSKAAIKVYKGDYTDAAKELSSAFIGYFPTGKAFQAAAEVIDAGIASWKDYELDKAYNSYLEAANDGKYGYKIKSDDWSTLCSQMNGYLARLQSEAKDAYCAVNKITRSELDADKTLSKQIADGVVTNLKKQFEHRLASKLEIEKKEAEYGKIIEGFQSSDLLTRTKFGYDVEQSVEERLRVLFNARKNILDMFGGEMPVLAVGESAEANLNQAIGKWITLGPKKRGEFYKWLEEKGYTSKVKLSGGGFAWVLSKTDTYDGKESMDATNKGGVYQVEASISTGNYYFKDTYIGETDTWYNPPKKNGESLAVQANWSTPPSQFAGGEKIELSVSIAATSNSQSFFSFSAKTEAYFDKYDITPGFSSGGYVSFVNADGKSSFGVEKKTNYTSLGDKVTATAPTGKAEGDKIALIVSFYMGVRQGTVYIYEWKEIA